MRAAVYTEYGPPEVFRIEEIPRPRPRDREVLVRVHATTATAADGLMRRPDTLMGRLIVGLRRPRKRFQVMGIELAGEVIEVGRAVTRFRVGDRVFGFSGMSVGCYAQYNCLPEDSSIMRMPENLSYEDAAAVVDGATTSMYFLEKRGGIRRGDRVLVIGASGSIGTAAVQLARLHGAEVTGVCSGRNASLVQSLGAHRVIDYTREDFSESGQTWDLIFDTVGKSSFAQCRPVLTSDGRYLQTVGGLWDYLRNFWSRLRGGKRFIYGMSIEKRESLRRVKALVEADQLQIVVDRRYPLEQIAAAHAYVATGRKRGNVVITVGHDGPR